MGRDGPGASIWEDFYDPRGRVRRTARGARKLRASYVVVVSLGAASSAGAP